MYLDQFSKSINSNPDIAIELAAAKRKICELESKLESMKTSNIAAVGAVAVKLQLTEHLRHHGVFKEVDGSEVMDLAKFETIMSDSLDQPVLSRVEMRSLTTAIEDDRSRLQLLQSEYDEQAVALSMYTGE